jgi:hypothetical protein
LQPYNTQILKQIHIDTYIHTCACLCATFVIQHENKKLIKLSCNDMLINSIWLLIRNLTLRIFRRFRSWEIKSRHLLNWFFNSFSYFILFPVQSRLFSFLPPFSQRPNGGLSKKLVLPNQSKASKQRDCSNHKRRRES